MAKSPVSISNKFHKLRDTINGSVKLRNEVYQKKDGSWDRLWAAMDALEDAQVAVDDFLSSKSISYLQLYGLLQAFVVQQDSTDLIRQTVIGANRIDWKGGQEPKLFTIRLLRNETVGHPAQIKTPKGTVYCNIDRSSISQDGFRYIIWDKSGANFHNIKFDNLIKTQETEIGRLSDDTVSQIIANDAAFIKQFAGDKLRDVYDTITSYEFEKLYGHESNLNIAKISFARLKREYAKVRSGLEKRYGQFGSTINAPGLKLVIDELDELITRVDERFQKNIPDAFDFSTYVKSLESSWSELGILVAETDTTFST